MLRPTRPDIQVRHDAARHGHHDRRPGSVVPRRSRNSRSRSRTASRRCRATCREETQSAFGCTACRIEVIPNFIDPDVYDRSRYTSQLDEQVDADARVLMHISNFRAGQARAGRRRASSRASRSEIPSVPRHGRRRPRSRRRRSTRRGRSACSDDVFFLGKIDTVAPLLASADLFLLPSQQRVVRA